MTKRVERIARKVMGDSAGVDDGRAGLVRNLHGIGARLLREYSDQIGLDPQFTTTTAKFRDLMNLIRHEKGFRRPKAASRPRELALHLLPLRQRGDRNRAGAWRVFSWCSGWAAELKELRGYVEAKQKQKCSITTTCFCIGADHDDPAWP